jgi:hypothetical protein
MTDNISLYRRDLLRKIAAAGLVHSCGMLGIIQQALAADALDVKQGVISATGEITVNGLRSRKGHAIKPGQTVKTGKGAEAIYVIESNAFLQRESTEVNFGANALTGFMRVVSGRILSVFGTGHKSLLVGSATIGIRGTACHIAMEPERAYFCLCYGEVEIMLPAPGKEPVQLKSSHHDKPIYIPSHGEENFQPAKMLDHNDDELKLLEALVGRLPPLMKG